MYLREFYNGFWEKSEARGTNTFLEGLVILVTNPFSFFRLVTVSARQSDLKMTGEVFFPLKSQQLSSSLGTN